jgi:ornithine cyclodeaminase/alanine dehydrogenase-like protein (mu-crystallin family)
MPRWLTEQDVRACLDPVALVDVMESALAELSCGKAVQPARTVIETAQRSFFLAMPAFSKQNGILGTKLVTVAPDNAARGLDTHLAAICLFEGATGELLAVMDGRYITEARTAAVSAVSVRHMARKDSRVLTILGTGVQARSHREAVARIASFDEVRVWSPTAEHMRRFADECSARAAGSAKEAVRNADVVLVATNTNVPAIQSDWVSPGTHIISIGAPRPTHREMDPALVARARLVVDSRATALAESGDVMLAGPDHISAELGEVVRGLKPGREGPEEITIFKSLGMAIEDVAAAEIAYRRAEELGLGLSLSLT